MITFLEKIRKKINRQFCPEEISLIDKSSLHSKHKSFNSKKFYIKLIIKSKKLREMSKIEAHKFIFAVLKNEMKTDIHALEIEIK